MSYSRTKRNGQLLRRYGLSLDEYEAIARDQGGRCAICRQLPASNRSLAVDHCHERGTIRGLLCDQCNCALGAFRDSASTVIAAIAYLVRSLESKQP